MSTVLNGLLVCTERFDCLQRHEFHIETTEANVWGVEIMSFIQHINYVWFGYRCGNKEHIYTVWQGHSVRVTQHPPSNDESNVIELCAIWQETMAKMRQKLCRHRHREWENARTVFRQWIEWSPAQGRLTNWKRCLIGFNYISFGWMWMRTYHIDSNTLRLYSSSQVDRLPKQWHTNWLKRTKNDFISLRFVHIFLHIHWLCLCLSVHGARCSVRMIAPHELWCWDNQ